MNWHLKEKAPEEFISKFPEYSPLILQLLYDRNLKTQSQIDEFFNSDYESDLHDPFLMKGVKEGVKEVKKAIKKKKKILIFGDYDADGICSTIILQQALKTIGAKDVDFYIPSRNKEGYGMNEDAVRKFADDGVQLIITVDCGITEVDNIKLAKKLGIETIIVDHHRCLDKIPPAKVIIDPHQSGDKYPFKELAAVGVVFKFIQALYQDHGVEEGAEKWFLDLVALATVADMMPLLGENRTLVKYGLVVLAQTKRVGLIELMKIARIDYSLDIIDNGNGKVEHKVSGLNSWTFAFALAPRINVAARLESVDSAYQLLITESEEEAEEIAKRLETLNRQRQQRTLSIVKEVEKRLLGKEMPKMIFEGDEEWPTGIVGLIAGKIKDKYHRPVFICNLEGDQVRCSGRSIEGYSLVELMSQVKSLLVAFGGHPVAAGLTVEKKNFEKLKKKISTIVEKDLQDENLTKEHEIDCKLSLDQVDWASYDQVQKFAPFGKGNQEPLFISENLEIVSKRTVGKTDQHLKMELFGPCSNNGSNMKRINTIGFGLAEKGAELKTGDCVDIMFEFLVNQWNGTRDLQLKIIDIKKHE